ncbi:MAG TPA: hypothetical protein EYN54_11520 [Methylococcaceae bacterium]|nr:hypothetical protein [Methylococcaceae bacterium]
MASSGEINGTACIVQNGTGEIVGQGSLTHTYGGTLIETSNKSNGDAVTYLAGENATKQHVLSGDFIYNNDTQFRKVREDILNGTPDTYTLTYVSDATTDESFSGLFFPTGLSDSLGMGTAVASTISFNSSGPVVHTPAVT